MIEKAGETAKCETADAQRKSKKTRRGKKKKVRYDDENNIQGEFEENFEPLHGNRSENEPYQVPEKTKVCREHDNRLKSCILRPIKVPQAPKNSTQFIIDDHEDCNLYFSFESQCPTTSEDLYVTSSPFAGFQDIDYEYESPDDVDNAAFYEQDFENIYRRAREEELLAIPKEAILGQYVELEQRVAELENQLAKKDPVLMIMKLQEQLLRLQDENLYLKKRNASLLGIPVADSSPEEELDVCAFDDDDEEDEDEEDIDIKELSDPSGDIEMENALLPPSPDRCPETDDVG